MVPHFQIMIVPTRNAFAPIILDAFDNAVPESNAAVIHWVCSQESHAKCWGTNNDKGKLRVPGKTPWRR